MASVNDLGKIPDGPLRKKKRRVRNLAQQVTEICSDLLGEAGKETYWNGDKGHYTGESKMLHGGKFYAVKMAGGPKKGQVVWTQKGPDDTGKPDPEAGGFKGKVPQADW